MFYLYTMWYGVDKHRWLLLGHMCLYLGLLIKYDFFAYI